MCVCGEMEMVIQALPSLLVAEFLIVGIGSGV
jgi:hypothetical protein